MTSARATLSFALTPLPHLGAQQSPEVQGPMAAPTIPLYPFDKGTLLFLLSLYHSEFLALLVIFIDFFLRIF